MSTKVHNVCIVGSGPAAVGSAIYTARAMLDPVLITGRAIGGQLMTTSEVENFPGYPEGVSGPEMMEDLHKQAKRFGTTFVSANVKSVDFSSRPLHIFLDNKQEILTHSVIIATGAQALWLNLDGEKKLRNKGMISSCAVCDGFFHKDEHLLVIGGGDSCMEEACFLTKFAKKVTIVHRRETFRASKIMLERAKKNPKIEWLTSSQPRAWTTDENGELTGAMINTLDGLKHVQCDAVFIAIGHKPSTDFLGGQIDLDENGYILHKDHTMTNIDGVFSAGDCTDHRYKQAITACGDGAKAGLDAVKWLSEQNL